MAMQKDVLQTHPLFAHLTGGIYHPKKSNQHDMVYRLPSPTKIKVIKKLRIISSSVCE
jgi:hypothetical protein